MRQGHGNSNERHGKMNRLLGFGGLGGYGVNFFMAPEGGAGGEGGGGGSGGAGGGAGGAGAGAGDAGAGGAAGGEGGAGGGAGGSGGIFGGQGGEGGGAGDATKGGALGGAGGKGEGGGAAGEIDWEKITDEEFFAKVEIPTIEGVNINKEFVQKTYGEFLRKHHISPEAVKDYLAMEGATFKKAFDAAKEKEAAETKAIKENFDAQGEALKKNFSEAQIETAVGALSTFAEDKDFMQVATTNLSNNSTLVKLLLNWAEHHKVDGTTGAGQGQGSGGLSGFAERWTGKKI